MGEIVIWGRDLPQKVKLAKGAKRVTELENQDKSPHCCTHKTNNSNSITAKTSTKTTLKIQKPRQQQFCRRLLDLNKYISYVQLCDSLVKIFSIFCIILVLHFLYYVSIILSYCSFINILHSLFLMRKSSNQFSFFILLAVQRC